MSEPPPKPDATQMLQALRTGDESVAPALLELVYHELHGLAAGLMRGERYDHTLQPTALVNEAWLKLAEGSARGADDRPHFLKLAARAMRQILVDHARSRSRQKRGGDRTRIEIDRAIDAWDEWQADQVDILDVEAALEKLQRDDEQLARVVELRFFGGSTLDEVGAALGMTQDAVRWAWKLARSWLRRELSHGRSDG